MIERIERQHSYSMNRVELPVAVCPEPDEITEFGRIKLPMPRKRVPGEALVKFGPPGRAQHKSALAQSTAPFDLLPRGRELLKVGKSEVQCTAPKDHAVGPISLVPGEPEKSASPALPQKKRPYIGQKIWLDGKRAIVTWLGAIKFESITAGENSKRRHKYSDYPDLLRGKSRVNRLSRESTNVAS